MCGLAGIFNYSQECNPEEVASLLSSSLYSRGPDDCGTFVDHTALMVHRRLSILDLSKAGHQPMHDHERKYVIVFNGEIYNYAQLREELIELGETFHSHSDTEVILNAYKQWGHECLHKFRGMFAFVIYEKETRSLFMARDRFGIKPLIWSKHNGQFVFASELTALVNTGLIDNTIDQGSLMSYLCTGSVRQPHTIYSGAFQLEPGHHMTVKSDGSYQSTRWYDLVKQTHDLRLELNKQNYTDLYEQLGAKLDTAARHHAVSDVTVGAFLSGGVDSAVVSALLGKHISGQLKAFSIGFEQQNEVIDELAGARDSALFLEAKHYAHTITDAQIPQLFSCFINKIDQPSIDGFNTFIVSKHTAAEVKVAISGLGGDELFAGYPHFAQIAQEYEKFSILPRPLLSMLHNLRPNSITRKLLYRGLSPAQADAMYRYGLPGGYVAQILNSGVLDTSSLARDNIEPTSLPPLAEITKAELEGYLLSTLLRDCDVCSMAHSLEVRPLLLDHEIVEFAFALPDSAKIKAGRQKAILNDATLELIAPACRRREKSGFELPFGRWASTVLRERFMDTLNSQISTSIFTNSHLKKIRASLGAPITARRHWRELSLLSWLEQNRISL